jgi:thiol-disulfide isomerase/thioredoxin
MKVVGYFLFILLFGIIGCQEKEIVVPDLNVGSRVVLAEELTGVRCPNCPEGSAELVALQKVYGENLVVVSIHAAGFYSVPYDNPPANAYDFRFAEAEEMAAYIGTAAGFPTAAINRSQVPPSDELYLFRPAWAGVIAQQAAQPPDIGVFLVSTFDPVSRRLDLNVNLIPERDLTGEYRLTVAITQDSMVDVQVSGLARIPDYVHRHVLRDIVTAPTGDVIEESLSSSATVSRHYSLTLPASLDVDHCAVVAFVHKGGGANKNVLQAVERKIR